MRLAVDPKTITKPPKTKPQTKEKPKVTTELEAPQPTAETELTNPTPVAPPRRQTPYLWRNRSQDDNVDRQGRRWTRD
jgi:penicillin-binding protein 1A